MGAEGVAVFFKATSKDSFQGSGKIPDVREALMTCAMYGARRGRALATTGERKHQLALAKTEIVILAVSTHPGINLRTKSSTSANCM